MPIQTEIDKIELPDFTTKELEGTGAFDVIMKAISVQVKEEWSAGRVTANNYSEVYLGSLQAGLSTALQLLMGKDKAFLEARLIEAQIAIQEVLKEKTLAEVQLVNAQQDQIEVTVRLTEAQILKVNKEIELLILDKEKSEAQIRLLNAQADKTLAEIPLVNQQVKNAIQEEKVLIATECKLKAEYDLIRQQIQKVISETSLMDQKRLTEKAQTDGSNVDPGSILGRQATLYKRQAEGFLRDAEQKAARIMTEVWQVQKSTDSSTIADENNKLTAQYIGQAVQKLLDGVNTQA